MKLLIGEIGTGKTYWARNNSKRTILMSSVNDIVKMGQRSWRGKIHVDLWCKIRKKDWDKLWKLRDFPFLIELHSDKPPVYFSSLVKAFFFPDENEKKSYVSNFFNGKKLNDIINNTQNWWQIKNYVDVVLFGGEVNKDVYLEMDDNWWFKIGLGLEKRIWQNSRYYKYLEKAVIR